MGPPPPTTGKETRLQEWGLLFALNLISLICIIDASKHNRNGEAKYVISTGIISVMICVVFYFNAKLANCSKKRDFLTGTIFEMLAVGVIFGLWCVALALINDKNVDFYTINNANLYYSSWGSFLMSLVLFFKVGRSFMNKKKEVKNPRLGYWALLSASSLIMMSASSQLFEEE